MSRIIDATLRFTDQFSRPMNNAIGKLERSGRQIQRVGKDVQKIGRNMQKVGSALTKSVTMPIVALGVGAVKTAAEFEKGMSKVQAISGATEKQIEKLSAKAQEMGAKTKFSAKESADAFSYMAMAGWKTKQMLGGIEGVMYLAGASGEDLAKTSDIVTDAMTAFGLEADKTSEVMKNGVEKEVNNTDRFVDVLAQTARRANTDVGMMGETFKYVAPVAGSLGYSIEDTAVAIGLMANSGIKGSQAGTQLRAAMVNLVNPTDKQKAMMDKLGISIEKKGGKMKSLMGVMKMLRDKMGTLSDAEKQENIETLLGKAAKDSAKEAIAGMTEEEIRNKAALSEGLKLIKDYDEGQLNSALSSQYKKKELAKMTEEEKRNLVAMKQGQIAVEGLSKAEQAGAAARIMGKEAMSGWLAIINASDKDFKKLTKEVRNSNGAAKEMYDIANNNLIGQLTILKSTVEAVARSFGERMTPHVKKAVEKLQDLADKFNKLSPKQQDHIIKLGLMAAAVGPSIFAFGKLTDGVGKSIEKLGKFGRKLPVISGRAKEASQILKTIHIPAPKGFGVLSKGMKGIGKGVSFLLSPLKKAGAGIVTFVGKSKLLSLPFKAFNKSFGLFGKMTMKLFSPLAKLGGMFGTVGKALFTFLGPTGSVIAVLAAIVIGGILVYKNWDKLKKAAKSLGQTIKNVFLNSGIDVDKLKERIAGMKESASKMFGNIGKSAKKMKKTLQPILSFIGHTFVNGFKVAFSAIIGYASGLINGIIEIGSGVMKALGGITDFVLGVFTGNWKKAWGGVKDIFKGTFQALVGLCKTPLNAVIGLVNGAIKGINKLGIDIPDWVPGLGGKKLHFEVPTIPMLYKGTSNWQGGTAMIHDRGAEIVDLPKGSRVYPHDKSLRMAREEGRKQGGSSISIAKLADTIVVREDADIDRIAERIVKRILEVSDNTGGVTIADMA
ncbi:phage tail tape measure protein [Velocimicrobium porci]|uniref:Phage tail tape measure protein n=1 Tax=Velocimicrobium porci TaxID=2606634 RepID=A0A6L5XZ20_9FIRM|nr:phage tail tape measure protein [Velocimicrobium porci]MSS63183.1 phage tail tape measure protein [Velocimicrobium porci]